MKLKLILHLKAPGNKLVIAVLLICYFSNVTNCETVRHSGHAAKVSVIMNSFRFMLIRTILILEPELMRPTRIS